MLTLQLHAVSPFVSVAPPSPSCWDDQPGVVGFFIGDLEEEIHGRSSLSFHVAGMCHIYLDLSRFSAAAAAAEVWDYRLTLLTVGNDRLTRGGR